MTGRDFDSHQDPIWPLLADTADKVASQVMTAFAGVMDELRVACFVERAAAYTG